MVEGRLIQEAFEVPRHPVAQGAERPPLDRALDTLRTLNALGDESGHRVPALVTLEGFEPWWFHQDLLYWELLLPLEEHLAEIESAVDSDAGDRRLSLPPEVTAALARLTPYLTDTPLEELLVRTTSPGERPRLAARIRQTAILALGWLGLFLARVRKLDTLLTSVDQVSPAQRSDFRVAELDRELRRRGYRLVEYLFSTSKDGFRAALSNTLRRRRLAVPFAKLANLLSRGAEAEVRPKPPLEQLGDDPRGILLRACVHWSLDRAAATRAEILALQKLLRFHRPTRAVLLDNRNSLALSAACSCLGIPTLGFMHGQFNRYHPTLMAYGFSGQRKHGFDLYGVWSEYFLERLERGDLFGRDRAFVSGPLRRPPDLTSAPRPPEKAIRVMLISESAGRQSEIAAYLEAILRDPRLRLSIKIRPGEDPPHVARAGIDLSRVEIVSTPTVYEALARTDVVLGSYSSVLFEASILPRPVVLLETSFPYGQELAEDGLALLATEPAKIVETVLEAASTPASELEQRQARLWGRSPGNGASQLLDVAEERLWPRPAGRLPAS